MPRVLKGVYVITDMPKPHTSMWEALRPTAALALVAVPVLSTTALIAGVLLGWPLPLLLLAAAGALPILVNLVDLIGSRAGWPPLSWTAAQIIAGSRPELPTKKEPTDV